MSHKLLLCCGLLAGFFGSPGCGRRTAAERAENASATASGMSAGSAASAGKEDDGDGPRQRRAGSIDWLEIKQLSPAFAGTSFGEVGPYDLIVAVAHGKLDPRHRANLGIVDLDKAARGSDGKVDYQADVVILRPHSPAHARRVLFYDVNNRGNKLATGGYFNEASSSDLLTAAGAGNGFLMKQGYTMVWSGWQGDIPLSGKGTPVGASFPVAKNADGSSITGLTFEEFIFDSPAGEVPGEPPKGLTYLTWPAATLDRSQARLSVKENQFDAYAPVSTWSYVDSQHIKITPAEGYDAGAIYQFVYTAKDPVVMGIGFAAVRDVIAFLRRDRADGRGNPNPLDDLRGAPCEERGDGEEDECDRDGAVDVAILEGISQSGRFVRDFLWQGFNNDGTGQRVFDGLMPLIGGGRKTWTNYRFAQPGRWSKQHEDHYQRGDQFPFTYATTHDPVSGQRDGLLRRCREDGTCPKVFQVDGGGEFWQGRASLVVSDGRGRALELPPDVRAYYMTGTPHGYSQTGVPARNPLCQYPGNIVNAGSTSRALLVDLVEWIARGVPPPSSRYPSNEKGTLAPSLPRARLGFPDLSPIGVNYTGLHNVLFLTDYGVVPPLADLAKPYEVPLPTTDADGNDIPGVRTPDVSVPLGTHLPWNPRASGHAQGEMCAGNGSFIAFASDAEVRAATHDPRPSVAERYPSHADYVSRVTGAARALQAQRLMIQEDVTFWIKKAEATTVP